MQEEAENGIAAHWYYNQQKYKKTDEAQVQKRFFAPTKKCLGLKN